MGGYPLTRNQDVERPFALACRWVQKRWLRRQAKAANQCASKSLRHDPARYGSADFPMPRSVLRFEWGRTHLVVRHQMLTLVVELDSERHQHLTTTARTTGSERAWLKSC